MKCNRDCVYYEIGGVNLLPHCTKNMKIGFDCPMYTSLETKTAKEMFEELGFEDLSVKENEIRYINNDKQIAFDKNKKLIGEWIWRGKSYKKYIPTKKEHKAITKQMEELGWL